MSQCAHVCLPTWKLIGPCHALRLVDMLTMHPITEHCEVKVLRLPDFAMPFTQSMCCYPCLRLGLQRDCGTELCKIQSRYCNMQSFVLTAVTQVFCICKCRKAFSKTEEVSAEFVLVSKIIHHLIRRDNALVVIDTPSRREDEALEVFNKRQQRERILAVNPNYAAE